MNAGLTYVPLCIPVNSFQKTNDSGLWSGNVTTCAHAYTIRSYVTDSSRSVLCYEDTKWSCCDKHQCGTKITVST